MVGIVLVSGLFFAAAFGVAWLTADRPPRFTTQQLLLSTTLIALGFGFLSAAYRVPLYHVPYYSVAAFCGVPLSGACLGAGVLLPFGKARFGAVYGLIVTTVVMCLLFDGVPAARE